MNEFEVIARISQNLPSPPPEIVVPIGDDCAVLRLGDSLWAAAADMLVEGHHFKGWATPEDVGYKAVAVNASDIAAMGAIPRFVLSSGGASDPDTTLRCFQGVLEACREFSVYPLGGDTTRAGALTIDVAILGELSHPPVLRSGAQPGDILAVTGELGAAAAGLLILENNAPYNSERLVRKHLRPTPRIHAGQAAARLGVHAMIDISDGLASDVRHICESSGVGCSIDLNLLPVSPDTAQAARSVNRTPEILAATGGEDYELLIASPERLIKALDTLLDLPVTIIGEVTGSGIEFLLNGESLPDLQGWDHFTPG